MAAFDFAPLYRSTIGFDRLFDLMDNSIRPDWPPYDIEKVDENQYRISMAVAGFSSDEIELTQVGPDLLVTGEKSANPGNRQMLHQGIARRNFRQTFKLADHVKVSAANLTNGLLAIDLIREVPEQLKPRRIEIGSQATAEEPKQIDQDTTRQAA
jgi:molecular chaperone IbpA